MVSSDMHIDIHTNIQDADKNKNRLYGVWGLGVSGTSIVRYLLACGHHVVALEKNSVPNAAFFTQHNVRIFRDPTERDEFFATCDTIIPSPGIDLRTHEQLLAKVLPEVDLFQRAWHKPIVAITGTLGKTSTTHLLSMLLTAAGMRVATGGNIGIGMLDLIATQNDHDSAVLELSSFQLEHATKISPHLAIITNIFDNHLDRHGTLDAYIKAKLTICAAQHDDAHTVLPLSLAPFIRADSRFQSRRLSWFSMSTPTTNEKRFIQHDDNCFVVTEQGFEWHSAGEQKLLLPTAEIPGISFTQNWLILTAACTLLGHDMQKLITQTRSQLSLPHNRLEHVATINGIDYFNDSKSTIMQATIAAVNERASQPIVLLLGGLSKGVDRRSYMHELAHVSHIICFGEEANRLATACAQQNIPATACQELEPALRAAQQLAQPGSCVLFSPGGASFDLFRNYEERGTAFVRLVKKMIAEQV